MNNNFDAILTAAQNENAVSNQKPEQKPYSKDAYREKKQNERDSCYRLADDTAKRATASSEVYASYLNVQARYNRYSVVNALLLTAQCPNATRLATFEQWQKNNVQIKKGSKAIMLLEPGKEYQMPDGRTGTHYNVKKVFDISQTDAQPHQTEISRDQKLLMKALIHNAPCVFSFDDNLPVGTDALYDPKTKTVSVRHGLESEKLFRALATELALAHMDHGEGFNRSDSMFRAQSIAYMVCARNRITPNAVSVPAELSNLDAKAFKQELKQIRDVANTMHNTMDQVLGKQREQPSQRTANPRDRDVR